MVLPQVCFGLERDHAVKIYGHETLHLRPDFRGESR